MKTFIAAALAGALVATTFAPLAQAQSGYETGTGKSSGATTNSGEARPDANKSSGGAAGGPSSNAAPTTTNSGPARPDASTASSKGAPKASASSGKKGATQTDD